MNYDSLLHRPIADGREFEKLIPKVKCEFGFSGEGNTDLSIQAMKAVVEKFSGQMAEVAKELESSSLDQTIDNVFAFCYDHFQYKADGEDQMLRSPACSWSVRFGGIDCKSYSIIASAVLREMGINHYIRKITQPGFQPTEFTHVYVVVPANQKTNAVADGYYVIDGTVAGNIEPEFLKTSDLFMSGLRHFSSLNGVAPFQSTPFGLAYGLASGPDDEPVGTSGNGSSQTLWGSATTQAGNYASGYISQQSSNFFKKISFKTVSQAFSTPIGCWGGAAYSDQWVGEDVNGMGKYCQLVLDEMNVALATNNMTAFSNKVCEFRGMVKIFVFCIVAKTTERQWNGCSFTNLIKVSKAGQFYHEVVLKAVDAWLEEYFTASAPAGNRTFTFVDVTTPNNIMPFCGWAGGAQPATVGKINYTKKTANVPVFQATDYLYTLAENPAGFNADNFMQGFQQLYNLATNPGSIFTGGGGTQNPGGGAQTGSGGTIAPAPSNEPNQAGSNLLMGGLVFGALVYGGMQLFGPNKPSKSTK